jgi:pantoate--beta-alanine ligase
MKQVEKIAALRKLIREEKCEGNRISFVPTMGALHDGHRSCIDVARARGDVLVVSIFLNPTQFGPGEDLKRYPADLARDLDLCRSWGCDIVFTPTADEMYPEPQTTWVEVGELAEPLCGRSRPGHFRGVATVVAKLFNAVEPDVAVFGQKDAQQALVIRAMVEQLDFPVELRLSPIVRERDGLALSSRNAYLSPEERARALGLSQGLEAGVAAIAAGEVAPQAVCDRARRHMESAGIDRVEYVELRDAASLRALPTITGRVILAAAAYVGSTRLIDNRVVEVRPGAGVELAPLF